MRGRVRVALVATLVTVAMAVSAPAAFAKQSAADCEKFLEKGEAKYLECVQKICPPEALECKKAEGDPK